MDNLPELPDFPVFSREHRPDPQTDFNAGSVFLIDKPYGWSSFRVIGVLRKLTGIRKIGHAGTLDPMATGLLIVCTGRATKQIFRFQDGIKQYRAAITFGASTPTYDKESESDQSAPSSHITLPMLQSTLLEQFTGELTQFPPVYSAIKQNGVPLYKLARKGVEVEVRARQVTIFENRIESFENGILTVHVTCAKGTYIRSLAHDLGLAVQSRAHLSALERTGSGSFLNSSALSIQTLTESLDPNGKTGLAF